jgi:phenylpropionate dioxygenase-like ring-hydroxylating dioxygenase large terminal subunit
MRRETEIELTERLLAHLEAGTTDMVVGATPNPVRRYLDPARLEREREVLFREHPLAVCHGSAVRSNGSFVTLGVAGVPVLVVRGVDGVLRAFLNVCRHRGTELVGERGGSARCFTCPYHAWTYDLDGRLIGVTHAEGFPPDVRDARNLVALPVAERHGFVWICAQPGAALDPPRYLGGLEPDLAALELERHFVYRPLTLHKRLHWKLAFDVFLEGYHVRFVHRDSIYALFLDNVGLYDRFAPHLRNVFPKRSIAELAGLPRERWSLREHVNVLYTVFPNTLLLVQPDHVSVFHVYPDGIDATRIEHYTLVPELPADERGARYWDKNLAILHGAIEEDFAMGESIQRGLASGANEELLFGRYEQALSWFHTHVSEALACRGCSD